MTPTLYIEGNKPDIQDNDVVTQKKIASMIYEATEGKKSVKVSAGMDLPAYDSVFYLYVGTTKNIGEIVFKKTGSIVGYVSYTYQNTAGEVITPTADNAQIQSMVLTVL